MKCAKDGYEAATLDEFVAHVRGHDSRSQPLRPSEAQTRSPNGGPSQSGQRLTKQTPVAAGHREEVIGGNESAGRAPLDSPAAPPLTRGEKLCAYPGCDRVKVRHNLQGYCTGHKMQHHRGEELRPLRRAPKPISQKDPPVNDFDKDEIVDLHCRLYRLLNRAKESGATIDLDAYQTLGTLPQHVHKTKKDHVHAVRALMDAMEVRRKQGPRIHPTESGDTSPTAAALPLAGRRLLTTTSRIGEVPYESQ